MKINKPFDLPGFIEIESSYKLDQKKKDLPLDNSGRATEKESIDWDSVKSIEISTEVEYSFIGAGSGFDMLSKGSFGHTARWLVTYSDSGIELDPDGTQPKLNGQPKRKGGLAVTAENLAVAQSKAGDKKPFVEFSFALTGSEDASGLGVSAGPVGASIGDAKSGGQMQCSLRLGLDVLNKPAPPMQIPKISRDLTSTSVYFEKKGDSDLPSNNMGLGEVKRWANEIKKNENLYIAIRDGAILITLEGNTSKSGKADFNAKLAKQRMDSVECALKTHLNSSKLALAKLPKAQNKSEEKNDYRVDISFEKAFAEVVLMGSKS